MTDLHDIHRVVDFEKVAPFTLRISFEDGTSQTVDFRSVLKGEIYEPLTDPAVFDQVRLDPDAHTLVWPNGADFDPATLHDWPTASAPFERLANTWKPVTTHSSR